MFLSKLNDYDNDDEFSDAEYPHLFIMYLVRSLHAGARTPFSTGGFKVKNQDLLCNMIC